MLCRRCEATASSAAVLCSLSVEHKQRLRTLLAEWRDRLAATAMSAQTIARALSSELFVSEGTSHQQRPLDFESEKDAPWC